MFCRRGRLCRHLALDAVRDHIVKLLARHRSPSVGGQGGATAVCETNRKNLQLSYWEKKVDMKSKAKSKAYPNFKLIKQKSVQEVNFIVGKGKKMEVICLFINN